MHIFRLKEITRSFLQGGQKISVLKNISAQFEQGANYAITGISGAGKSTLLHIIAGIETPTSGTVFYDNQPLSQHSFAQRSQFLTHLGLIFQQPYLIKELTILENVMIKGHLASQESEQVGQKAEMLLKEVGLADKIDAMPGQLSGGQQQRVAIARALLNRPAFLLADEPTGSLDVKTGTEIMNLLLKLAEEWQMGLIISSHEPYVYEKMERVLVLENGVLK